MVIHEPRIFSGPGIKYALKPYTRQRSGFFSRNPARVRGARGFVSRKAYSSFVPAKVTPSPSPARCALAPGAAISAKRSAALFFIDNRDTAIQYTGEHAQQRVFLAQPCEGDLHLAACPHTEGEWGERDGYACSGGTSYRHQPRGPAMPSRRRRFRRFRYSFR